MPAGYRKLLVTTLALALGVGSATAAGTCSLIRKQVFRHAEIGTVQVLQDPATHALVFASQMQVNTDGAPDSYHPDDIGITYICNGISVGPNCSWEPSCLPAFRRARSEGFRGPTKICFFAIATDKDGMPLIQGARDPKPGYFVSTTALHQPGHDPRGPQGQLDSNSVPFAVIPSTWQRNGQPGPKLGDYGVAFRRSTGKLAFFVVGDIGPANKVGEGSVALHRALGNDPFEKRSGVLRARKGIGGRDVIYVMFPGSASPGKPIDAAVIERTARPLFERFGGNERLQACATSIIGK